MRNEHIAREPLRGSHDLFVPRYDSFPMNPEKKDTHSLNIPGATMSKNLPPPPPYQASDYIDSHLYLLILMDFSLDIQDKIYNEAENWKLENKHFYK